MELTFQMRAARAADVDALATLWHDGWHDAHAPIVPADLTKLRTLDSFRERLAKAVPRTRVVERAGQLLAFYILKDDELYQFYVDRVARGSAVAALMIADAETRLATSGVKTAWLACAIGNDRAARFYEKCGWRRAGTMINRLDTPAGEYLLDVWRYEKALVPSSTPGSHPNA